MSDKAQTSRDASTGPRRAASLIAAALVAAAASAALAADPAGTAKPAPATTGRPAAAQAAAAATAAAVVPTEARPGGIAPGRAPTIQSMSDLYAAEMAAQAQKRLEKLYAPYAASAAQPAATGKAVVKPAFFEPKVEVPTTKRVLAIYGRAGAEAADLERPDGTVVAVRPGMTFEGYRVLRVTAKFVELEGKRSVTETVGAGKKGAKGHAPVAASASEVGDGHRVARVEAFTLKQAVGSTFK